MSKYNPYIYLKRFMDFIVALFLLIALFPIFILAALAVKLEDPKGPILFKQERPGKKGRIFTVYKFRTMCVAREENGKKLSDSERLTKTGMFLRKTSIDELPQLINVLKGEMSFIGPRPLLVKYLPFYTREEARRHDVRPGISGWAQVNGRNTVNWDERLRLDVEYVEQFSLKMDLKIFFLTIYKIFKRSNVEVDALPDFDIDRRSQQREIQI